MLFLSECGWNGFPVRQLLLLCLLIFLHRLHTGSCTHTCTLMWEHWLHIHYNPLPGSRQVLAQTQYFPWGGALWLFVWSSSFISTVQRTQRIFYCYCSCWLVQLIEIWVSDLSLFKKNKIPILSSLISYANLMFSVMNSKAPKLL